MNKEEGKKPVRNVRKTNKRKKEVDREKLKKQYKSRRENYRKIVPALIELYADFPEVLDELEALKPLNCLSAEDAKPIKIRYRNACLAARQRLQETCETVRKNAFAAQNFLKCGSQKSFERCCENIRDASATLERERGRFFKLVSYYSFFRVKRAGILPSGKKGESKSVYMEFYRDARAFLDGELAEPPEWPFGKKTE